MWSPFLHEEVNYLMKVDLDGIKICLTDLQTLWIESLTQNDLVNKFKEVNPLFNGSEEESLEVSKKLISDVNTINQIDRQPEVCIVHMKTKVGELPVKISCNLKKGDPSLLFNDVTIPLIKTVQFLELKMNKQAELLKKKDREIQEYVFEYGEINAKHLITASYEKDSEELVDGLLLNVFTKSDAFQKVIAKNIGDIETDFPELKKEIKEKVKLTLPKKRKK